MNDKIKRINYGTIMNLMISVHTLTPLPFLIWCSNLSLNLFYFYLFQFINKSIIIFYNYKKNNDSLKSSKRKFPNNLSNHN